MKEVPLYKVGDRVRIKNTSPYYLDNKYDNPKNVDGFINIPYIFNGFHWQVNWDNGGHNCYSEKDLELVDSKIVSNVTIVEELKQEVRPRRRLLI
jgi:hypothetical protein